MTMGTRWITLVLVLLTLACAALSFFVGPSHLPAGAILQGLFDGQGIAGTIAREIRLPRAGLGIVVGAALRGETLWGEFLVFGPALAMTSAVCAAGSLALARRAERRELPDPSGDPAEAELTEDEKRELLGRGD